jgi:hypothetical protein
MKGLIEGFACVATALIVAPGCAMDVTTDPGAEDEVGVAVSALSGSSVPGAIWVIDQTNDGSIEWVYTPHGLSFGANRTGARGQLHLVNESSVQVKTWIHLDAECLNSNVNAHIGATLLTVPAGDMRTLEVTCPSGTATKVITSFVGIESSALEVGYEAFLFDMAPNEVVLQDNFVDNVPVRVTGDWGGILGVTAGARSAELQFRNPGMWPLRVQYELHVSCTGTNSRKRTGTFDAPADDTWTRLTVSCANRAAAKSAQIRSNGWTAI